MKFFRNILKGASLTTALFVFQACYGMPPVGMDKNFVLIKILDAENDSPINDVTISLRTKESAEAGLPWSLRGYSKGTGECLLYFEDELVGKDVELHISPSSSDYAQKDTVVANFGGETIVAKLQKSSI